MTASERPPASVTFVGNATTVLRIGDFTLLTDPNFLHAGRRAHLGYGIWTRRRTDPAMGVPELPPLDAVLYPEIDAMVVHLGGARARRAADHGRAAGRPAHPAWSAPGWPCPCTTATTRRSGRRSPTTCA